MQSRAYQTKTFILLRITFYYIHQFQSFRENQQHLYAKIFFLRATFSELQEQPFRYQHFAHNGALASRFSNSYVMMILLPDPADTLTRSGNHVSRFVPIFRKDIHYFPHAKKSIPPRKNDPNDDDGNGTD